MRDILRRHAEYQKQLKRDKKKGVQTTLVTVFNVRRVGHRIVVPGLAVDEVKPMSLRMIKKRDPEAMKNDSKEYYPDNFMKPKVITWKAYGKNTPPERVSRILA